MKPGSIFNAVSSRIFPDDADPVVGQPPTFGDTVEHARRDWLAAKSYFEAVTDPDLVDHAIYVLEAAERKYMYLIKRAKVEGLTTGS
ncbi:MAG: YaaL family protein [Bacillota bacterium]